MQTQSKGAYLRFIRRRHAGVTCTIGVTSSDTLFALTVQIDPSQVVDCLTLGWCPLPSEWEEEKTADSQEANSVQCVVYALLATSPCWQWCSCCCKAFRAPQVCNHPRTVIPMIQATWYHRDGAVCTCNSTHRLKQRLQQQGRDVTRCHTGLQLKAAELQLVHGASLLSSSPI
jgi:hypothetical protein